MCMGKGPIFRYLCRGSNIGIIIPKVLVGETYVLRGWSQKNRDFKLQFFQFQERYVNVKNY